MTLFVQLYESNPDAVKSEIATFFEVFPNGVVWGNTYNGAGYDLVLLGQVEPTRIDVEAVQRHLVEPSMRRVAQSLGEIGMYSSIDLFSTYAGMKSDLAPWLADAAINRDRNLRLQYLAGMGFNLYQSEAIYADMLPIQPVPEGSVRGQRRDAAAAARSDHAHAGEVGAVVPGSGIRDAGSDRSNPISRISDPRFRIPHPGSRIPIHVEDQ